MREAGSGLNVKPDLCKCSRPKPTRLNRVGLVDMIFSCFGRYPWGCRSCGMRRYCRERSRKKSGLNQRVDHVQSFREDRR